VALENERLLRELGERELKAFTDDEGNPFFDEMTLSAWMEQETMHEREEDENESRESGFVA
jgi:hypothetical protein